MIEQSISNIQPNIVILDLPFLTCVTDEEAVFRSYKASNCRRMARR